MYDSFLEIVQLKIFFYLQNKIEKKLVDINKFKNRIDKLLDTFNLLNKYLKEEEFFNYFLKIDFINKSVYKKI
ncbi:hypothetical protein BpHYR1_001858 [Brachionus plicatilis]|uniref:Uncharacterized protein n=1 Tax=Brachionus plicatilis TaxID=10195 RepID=A0A3M7PFR4_BRAPC|nr:hypothetical protein BpHYR1_001858 [Brachionus plicatilis]